jgi:hypothetical protein
LRSLSVKVSTGFAFARIVQIIITTMSWLSLDLNFPTGSPSWSKLSMWNSFFAVKDLLVTRTLSGETYNQVAPISNNLPAFQNWSSLETNWFRNIPKYPETSRNIPKHPETSRDSIYINDWSTEFLQQSWSFHLKYRYKHAWTRNPRTINEETKLQTTGYVIRRGITIKSDLDWLSSINLTCLFVNSILSPLRNVVSAQKFPEMRRVGSRNHFSFQMIYQWLVVALHPHSLLYSFVISIPPIANRSADWIILSR